MPVSNFAERVVAAVLLLALAPVMIALVVAVRLDSPGPALFRQVRLGRGRRAFTVYKFRTMHVGADAGRHREYVAGLIRGVERAFAAGNGHVFKLVGDERVTRLGGLLRRLSLDELPQLINVVRGEMSLVGPRPVLAYEADLYPAGWDVRFAVRPGLTGLWQVSGRNERSYREMVELDLEYVRTRSLLLDLRILAKTAWVVLRPKGVA